MCRAYEALGLEGQPQALPVGKREPCSGWASRRCTEEYWVVQLSTEQQHPSSVAGVGAGAVSVVQALSHLPFSMGARPLPRLLSKTLVPRCGFHLLSGD